MKHPLSHRLVRIIASRQMFYVLLGFFVFESMWIALSARYPMAFDEDFHFGIIKLYAANHFSPFFASQPPHADSYGAVTRDPSYLYHYIMSFPYRLVAACTDSQTIQIIFLRLINVGFVAGGLVATRSLLLRIKLSRALTHSVLAVFVLVPIVPLLAGQINYDNLLILTVPITLILAVDVLRGLQSQKIYVSKTVLLASALLLESLIKYAFLPIAAAIVAYLTYYAVRVFWRRKSAFIAAIIRDYRTLSRKVLVGLAVVLIISAGLFLQRYGVNAVKYHKLAPDCAVVLTEKRCQTNGPWLRNEQYEAQKISVNPNPFVYTNQWLHAMVLRSFFAINGPFSSYVNNFPLVLPQAAAKIFFIASVLLGIVFFRNIFRRSELQLLLLVIALYVISLWVDDYHGYLLTGQPVAVNGRYLLLILPIGLAFSGMAFVRLLQKVRRPFLKPWLAILVIALFLQGGGFITFILQSDPSWYWQNSQAVTNMNAAARTVLRPLVWKKLATSYLKYE